VTATRSALRAFLDSEAAGGIVLMVAAAAAMVIANSPLGPDYYHLLEAHAGSNEVPGIARATLHFWINDGLMAIFFLLVGLEIKRELTDGRLSRPEQRRLPFFAAAVGMAVPAFVYLALIGDNPTLAQGWAIPAATDIAFAMGVMALVGKRVPTSLKLLLVTIAIVDDIGAVAIIAFFYSTGLNFWALGAAAALWAVLMLLNRQGVRSLPPYLIGFALLWYAVLLSGIHATIAGIAAAFTIPVIPTPGTPDSAVSPLHRLEHALDAPVSFVIVPLFGLANAGVSFHGMRLADVTAPLPLAIALALFLGKQAGISAAIWAGVRWGLAPVPRGATWLQIYGLALLCGIGFTMSLFIGGLAFNEPGHGGAVRLGILMGSLVSALAGYAVLRFAPLHPDHAMEALRQDAEIARDGDTL
jgi:NhaA family Na+:H+ antiporter